MHTLITQNFHRHAYLIPARTPGMQVVHLPHLTYVDSGLSCDTFNIIHINNGKKLKEEELQEALQHYRNRRLDYCLWITEENLTENVRQFFTQNKLTQQNKEAGMVLDLNTYEPLQNDLHDHIAEVKNEQQLADYAGVIANNWNPPDQNVLDYYRQSGGRYLDEKNEILLFVFYFDGVPVCTVELFPSDEETIGLYGLATLEAYRGRGIGSALMSFSLNKAKALGYKKAILQASDDGIRIYRRLGFETLTYYFEYA